MNLAASVISTAINNKLIAFTFTSNSFCLSLTLCRSIWCSHTHAPCSKFNHCRFYWMRSILFIAFDFAHRLIWFDAIVLWYDYSIMVWKCVHFFSVVSNGSTWMVYACIFHIIAWFFVGFLFTMIPSVDLTPSNKNTDSIDVSF